MEPRLLEQLRIDCGNCCGLCCAALFFAKSDGFPADKPAGVPCGNLGADFRCQIHGELKQRKCTGCMAYDCFGAGQAVTRMYGGRTWRDSGTARRMFDDFLLVVRLHQTLWYLGEAVALLPPGRREEAETLLSEGRSALLSPEALGTYDAEGHRARSNRLLKPLCAQGRRVSGGPGKNFLRAKLDGADFSMAVLIAADLEGCGLADANFLGADLRDANVKNTDLRRCRFLTQGQINAAKGNRKTLLPATLCRPGTW